MGTYNRAKELTVVFVLEIWDIEWGGWSIEGVYSKRSDAEFDAAKINFPPHPLHQSIITKMRIK